MATCFADIVLRKLVGAFIAIFKPYWCRRDRCGMGWLKVFRLVGTLFYLAKTLWGQWCYHIYNDVLLFWELCLRLRKQLVKTLSWERKDAQWSEFGMTFVISSKKNDLAISILLSNLCQILPCHIYCCLHASDVWHFFLPRTSGMELIIYHKIPLNMWFH